LAGNWFIFEKSTHMKVSKEMVERVAKLAKLEFDESGIAAMQKDLDRILDLCEKLNEVDTDNVEPLIHMTETNNRWREDEAKCVVDKQEALKNAPDKNSDYFKVPKVIERK